jgi:acetyl esterase/lipase
MKAKKIIGIILAIIVLILVLFTVIKPDLARIILHNLYSPSVKLDTSSEWEGGASYEKLAYSDISESDYMNLYVPDSDEPMPLIVMVHGGGFVYNDCESRQAQLMYRYFRDQGYACASINYRLAQEAGFPAALQDVKAAIRYLRANAEKYGYDPERFAIWGESAGGYLAVMAAVTNDEEFNDVTFIGEEELEESVSAKVSVILDFYGVMDMGMQEQEYEELGIPKIVLTVAAQWLTNAVKNLDEYETVEDYWLRKKLEEIPEEEMLQYYPSTYIKENLSADSDLRVVIWHGDADLDVPYIQSERLQALMEETIGADKVDYQLFHNYKHAADAFYSDDSLVNLKEYLDKVL